MLLVIGGFHMSRKLNVLFVCFSLILSLSACGYDISKIPNGVLLSTHYSPSEKYTVNIYLCDGSATVDSSIRGELVNNETGDKQNIYWNYHEDTATVMWIDDLTVVINGHQLNLPNDAFDFREH